MKAKRAKMWVICIGMVTILLSSCGMGAEVNIYPDKVSTKPGGKVRLNANVEYFNNTDRRIRVSYFWTIETADCGSLSSSTAQSVTWTAPHGVDTSRSCIVRVTAVFKYYSDGSIVDTAIERYAILVDPESSS